MGMLIFSFELPLNKSTVVIPADIPIKVASPVNTSIAENITVTLKCNSASSSANFPLITNVLYNATYPSYIFGTCSVDVTDAPEYFNLPIGVGVSVSLKYQLSFTSSQRILMSNSFFGTKVISSASTPIGLSSTTIILECNNSLIQEWQSVPLNQETLLHLGYVEPSEVGCYLKTSGNDEYFIQDSVLVTHEINNSPFGGSYKYISPEQIKQFAHNVSLYDGYIEITKPMN